MKKFLIVLIIILSGVFFAVIVYFGFKYARGIPVSVEETKRPILEVPLLDTEIDLSKNIKVTLWDTLSAQKIKLLYQIMVLPWPKKVVPYINVKAFHNQKDIYFYLEWIDNTEDKVIQINKFSDAAALMFPLEEKTQVPTLMMGFLGKADIWQWKASQDQQYWLKQNFEPETYVDFHYPFEEEELLVVSKDEPLSAVNDLLAIRVGTVTPKPQQIVAGKGIYEQGIWKVVFKRSLNTTDKEVDAQFPQGKKLLCSFAVWNGSQGDRGGRKSISDWVELVVK